MKKVNVEKFLADYELAVKEKEDLLERKEAVLMAEKADIEALPEKYNSVKEKLFAEVAAEKEKEFDFVAVDEKIAGFEKYLEDVEEVVEEDKPVEDVAVEAPIVDEFGNPVVQ